MSFADRIVKIEDGAIAAAPEPELVPAGLLLRGEGAAAVSLV